MYADIFSYQDSKEPEKKPVDMKDLFGNPKPVQESVQPKGLFDLFGAQIPQSQTPIDLFKNVPVTEPEPQPIVKPKADLFANAPVYQQPLAPTQPAVHVPVNSTQADISIFNNVTFSKAEVSERFKKLVAVNEELTHIMIDLSQEMQLEQQKIEAVRKRLTDNVEAIQKAIAPQKTFLGKKIPTDVNLVNSLIDAAQLNSKNKFEIDAFFMSKLSSAFMRSDETKNLIVHLETLATKNLDNTDPLLQRIVKSRKLIELQYISTKQTLSMLQNTYDNIENYRVDTLVVIVLEAQHHLRTK